MVFNYMVSLHITGLIYFNLHYVLVFRQLFLRIQPLYTKHKKFYLFFGSQVPDTNVAQYFKTKQPKIFFEALDNQGIVP